MSEAYIKIPRHRALEVATLVRQQIHLERASMFADLAEYEQRKRDEYDALSFWKRLFAHDPREPTISGGFHEAMLYHRAENAGKNALASADAITETAGDSIGDLLIDCQLWAVLKRWAYSNE